MVLLTVEIVDGILCDYAQRRSIGWKVPNPLTIEIAIRMMAVDGS